MLVHHELQSGRQDGSAQIALQISEHLAAAIVQCKSSQPRHLVERVAKPSGRQRCRGWSIDGPHPDLGYGRLFASPRGVA